MHDLNQYDFHARQYDPAVIRFTAMDPMAEFRYSSSPYTYVLNNPLKYIDKNGMDTTYVNPSGTEIDRRPGGEDLVVNTIDDIEVSPQSNSNNGVTATSFGIASGISSFVSWNYQNYTDAYKSGGFLFTYEGATTTKSIQYFYGNQYISKSTVALQKANFLTKIDLLKGVKISGHFLTDGGVVIDIVGVHNYYKNPGSSLIVTPEKAGLNTGIAGLSYWIPQLGITHVVMDNL